MGSLAAMSLWVNKNLMATETKSKCIGIVGLDSSHAIAFTKELHANLANNTYKSYQVVAAYPMGSPTIPLNAKRIPTFTEEIKKLGVEVVDSIPALLKKVDVVLLETNDGNKHLEQAELILKARKPLFIDKPIANSYEDAVKIFELSEKYQTPVFSSSALRYISGIDNIDKAKVLGAEIYSPAYTEPSHKDLYWYGIHGVEMLFAIMGTDCISVQTQTGADADIHVAEWPGNRIATLRGIKKGGDGFGGTVFTEDKIITLGAYQGYAPLLQRIINFFETGKSPVASIETLAICKFIDAAHQSRLNGGTKVFLKTNE